MADKDCAAGDVNFFQGQDFEALASAEESMPPGFEPPERPYSAPPDQVELALFAPWTDPPDRPRSAPPGDNDEERLQDGLGTSSGGASSSASRAGGTRLGAIGSARGRVNRAVPSSSWGSVLDPRATNMFSFQARSGQKAAEQKLHPRMPLSPTPPLKEEDFSGDEDGEGIGSPEVTHPPRRPSHASGSSDAEQRALYIALQAAQGGSTGPGLAETGSLADLAESRRSTPPPVGLHAGLHGSPGPHTPPPGFGSPSASGFGSLHQGVGDDGPQLLHPGAVRAFDPIDRPISAPPALDISNASFLALQASIGSGIQTPDIRCDETYNDFYQHFHEQNPNLPPPLDPSPEIVRSRARSGGSSELNAQGDGADPAASGAGASGFGFGLYDRHGMMAAAAAAYHAAGAHVPRSPSPPWDGAGALANAGAIQASHHAAAVAAAAAQHAAVAQAQHAVMAQAQAQAQLRQQQHHAAAAAAAAAAGPQQQQPTPPGPGQGAAGTGVPQQQTQPMQPTPQTAPPVVATPNDTLPSAVNGADAYASNAASAAAAAAAAAGYPPAAVAAAAAAALRHSPLLGTPGYPIGTTYSDAQNPAMNPFLWQQLNMQAAATAAGIGSAPAPVGIPGMPLTASRPLGQPAGGALMSQTLNPQQQPGGPARADLGPLATLPESVATAQPVPQPASKAVGGGRSNAGPVARNAGGGGATAGRGGAEKGNDNGKKSASGPGGGGTASSMNSSSQAASPDDGVRANAALQVANAHGRGEPNTDHVAERKQNRGFKLSALEDMFSTNGFVNNVYNIARDQAGCRMLQHKLDEGNAEVASTIFTEVLAHCVELMMDPFGNYLCQKLMDMCNARQLELILDKVCDSLVRISLDMHGARAVQKLIDAVRTTPHMPRLVGALDGAVVALTKDPNGNHVVQRCLESMPIDSHGFIFRAIAAEIVDVATHRHGCRIVQRCIDVAQNADKQQLTYAICTNSLTLVQDPFGNYVVQHVVAQNNPQATQIIVQCMLGRLNVLSRQKFSSNVVEKCLHICSPEDKERMINELCDARSLGELLRDVYGNYVVQSALSSAQEPLLSVMLTAVRPLLPSLRASGQGRRIAQKLEKKYPQLRPSGTLGNEASGSRGGGGGSGGASSNAGGGARAADSGRIGVSPIDLAGATSAAATQQAMPQQLQLPQHQQIGGHLTGSSPPQGLPLMNVGSQIRLGDALGAGGVPGMGILMTGNINQTAPSLLAGFPGGTVTAGLPQMQQLQMQQIQQMQQQQQQHQQQQQQQVLPGGSVGQQASGAAAQSQHAAGGGGRQRRGGRKK